MWWRLADPVYWFGYDEARGACRRPLSPTGMGTGPVVAEGWLVDVVRADGVRCTREVD
jgi:hypothetical protein